MTSEQNDQLNAFLATLPGLDQEQLFEALQEARIAKGAASEDLVPLWRAKMIGIGEQLHRRLGPGALQEFGKRYG